METTVEIWNTGLNVLSMIPKFWKRSAEQELRGLCSFVMKAEEAKDYQICEKNAEIEIQDGFNSNLVVQRYYETRKIIIYIPRKWTKKISVEVTEGKIICRQKEPYRGLRLLVTKGELIF